jgi:hypothetical protein
MLVNADFMGAGGKVPYLAVTKSEIIEGIYNYTRSRLQHLSPDNLAEMGIAPAASGKSGEPILESVVWLLMECAEETARKACFARRQWLDSADY